MKRTFALLVLQLALVMSCHAYVTKVSPPPPGWEAHFEEDVLQQLKTMSVADKIGQMTQLDFTMFTTGVNTIDKTKLADLVSKYGFGSSLNGNMDVQQWMAYLTELMTIANSASKNGIPILYGLDSVHGANYIFGAALFPQHIGGAATFNTDLMHEEGKITAKDTTAIGIPWIFAPVLDVAINPLWSRVYETFGEDPYLSAQMGAALVRGMQGSAINATGSGAACTKHFTGYSDPVSGHDRTPAWIPERQLREYFLPPFREVLTNIGARSVMANSGSINGIPIHADRRILTDILRNELGFTGVVVSDWADIEHLVEWYHVAADQREAVKIAIDAGIDMSMVPLDTSFCDLLMSLVLSGEVPESRLDLSVARILQLKYDLGLFKTMGMPDPNNPLLATIGSAQDRSLALQSARESITLLRNSDSLLPLDPSKLNNVLVTGPCADSLARLSGGWTIYWQGATSESQFRFGKTILQGVQDVMGHSKVTYVQGSDIDQVTDLAQAVTAAQKADVIILAVGENPYAEVPGTINDLTLPDAQLQLIEAMYKTGKPVVLVLVEGRPRVIPPSNPGSSLIGQVLMAYLPGPEGGQAISEIIFGQVNPSGRLSITYPRTTGDISQYYHTYADEINGKVQPWFPFGHGLSYTTFTYSLTLSATDVYLSRFSLQITVTVKNTGKLEGKDSVLLFLSDTYASITPPVKRLRRFAKTRSLVPGQSETFQWNLQLSDLSFIGLENLPVVEPGDFVVLVGSESASFKLHA